MSERFPTRRLPDVMGLVRPIAVMSTRSWNYIDMGVQSYIMAIGHNTLRIAFTDGIAGVGLWPEE